MMLLSISLKVVFRYPLPHFLLHFHHHFAPASQHLLYPVEELEEEFLASEDEAGSMGLADEDAALAADGTDHCPAESWDKEGHEAHPGTRTFHDSCAPCGKACRFRGEEREDPP